MVLSLSHNPFLSSFIPQRGLPLNTIPFFSSSLSLLPPVSFLPISNEGAFCKTPSVLCPLSLIPPSTLLSHSLLRVSDQSQLSCDREGRGYFFHRDMLCVCESDFLLELVESGGRVWRWVEACVPGGAVAQCHTLLATIQQQVRGYIKFHLKWMLFLSPTARGHSPPVSLSLSCLLWDPCSHLPALCCQATLCTGSSPQLIALMGRFCVFVRGGAPVIFRGVGGGWVGVALHSELGAIGS